MTDCNPHSTSGDEEPSECARAARRYELDDELTVSPLPRALRALAAWYTPPVTPRPVLSRAAPDSRELF